MSAAASEEARQSGNDFYRKGQFIQAEKAYEEAIKLDPKSPTPWSNISALKFEQGNYIAAIQSLDKALALLPSEPDDSPTKQKLHIRKAKCHLHLLSFTSFDGVLQKLTKNDVDDSLRSSLKEFQHLWSAVPDETAFRKQIFDRLPRYKSSVLDVTEYYAMGHDTTETLVDEELQSNVRPADNIAFLLCGSGDARHLLQSIFDLFMWNNLAAGTRGSKFNKALFTLVDVNAAALAKTIILFDMFFVYVVMKTQKMPRIEDAVTNMAYMYSSAFVPRFVVDKMTESINSLIDGFEKDINAGVPGSSVINILYLPETTRAQVLQKLKQWVKPLPDEYSPQSLRASSTKSRQSFEEKRRSDFGPKGMENSSYAKQCQQDVSALGVLFAERVWLQRRDPELIPFLDAFRSGRPDSKRALEEYIDTHWKTNPTVIDLDYLRQRKDRDYLTPETEKPKLDWNPSELLLQIALPMSTVRADKSVIGNLADVFDHVSLSVASLISRLEIEVIAGEMADVLERIQHNCLEHRSHKPPNANSVDPTSFLYKYDRIHMSNIPDYIGGPLTAFMYAKSLLRTDRPSNLRFNCLLNPPMFRTHEDFLSEYLLMYDSEKVANHFGLVCVKEPRTAESSLPPEALQLGPFVTENYFIWTHYSGTTDRIPRNKMMSRPVLEHWLFGHLLKICLPHVRPVHSDRPVYAPLNLTAFFRLVTRMHEVGYPAHWLSDILAAVCTGSITTTARAPRQIALNTEEVTKYHKARKINLGPWKAEYTTLLSLWRRILPFGILTRNSTLVPLEQIVKCSLTFPDFPHYYGKAPHFAIVFFNTDLLKDDDDDNNNNNKNKNLKLPDMIQDDDERGDTSAFANRFRDQGIHMVTTFRYVTDTRTATMWMRQDIVNEMLLQRGKACWKVGICRTDVWQLLDSSIASPQKILRQINDSWIETS